MARASNGNDEQRADNAMWSHCIITLILAALLYRKLNKTRSCSCRHRSTARAAFDGRNLGARGDLRAACRLGTDILAGVTGGFYSPQEQQQLVGLVLRHGIVKPLNQ